MKPPRVRVLQVGAASLALLVSGALASGGAGARGVDSGVRVVALDARTGATRWSAKPALAVPVGQPAVAGDRLSVWGQSTCVGQSGALVVLDAKTGKSRWRTATGAAALGVNANAGGSVSPVVDAGTAVVSASGTSPQILVTPPSSGAGTRRQLATRRRTLRGLDAATGKERWHTAVPAAGQLVDVGDVVVVVTGPDPNDPAGNSSSPPRPLAAGLERATGKTLWLSELPAVAPIAVGDGAFFVVAQGGAGTGLASSAVFAIDAKTGQTRWQAPLDGFSLVRPAVSGSVVVTGTQTRSATSSVGFDRTLVAFDVATGQVRWRTSQSAVAVGANLAGTPDGLFLLGQSAVIAVDPATGGVRWTAPFSLSSGAITASADVVVVSSLGSWSVFDAKDGHALWDATSVDAPAGPPIVSGDTMFVVQGGLECTTG
jgi:outer membrane protein assembly factor BamB